MENATKALLIAAGVLIVILLIAFGMSIFNSTGDTSGQVEDASASQQMQAFNGNFQQYVGKRISQAQLRNLVVAINKSNERNPQHPIDLIVTSAGGATVTSSGTQYTFAEGSSRPTTMFEITATYDDNGYINAITAN